MQDVKAHYDRQARQQHTLQTREEDPAFELYLYNNWIKAILIDRYCQQQRVLDLGCGRGGDLKKFLHANVQHYVGTDLSTENLIAAKKRLSCSKYQERMQFYQVDFTQKATIATHLHTISICNFAAHYAGENAVTLSNLFSNLTSQLCTGGYVILTLPNEEKMKKFIAKCRQHPHPYCSAVPVENEDRAYLFTLSNRIVNCKEWLLPNAMLQEAAKQNDLTLLYQSGFLEFTNSSLLEDKNALRLRNIIKVPNVMKETDREIADLYMVQIYVKSLVRQ